MEKVKIAVIGCGNIGVTHISYLLNHEVEGAELAAVCDINPNKLKNVQEQYGDGFKFYPTLDSVLADDEIDAVIIGTPHFEHPGMVIQTLRAGKHVLSEKPAGVYTKKVREMIEESEKYPELTFAVMYNQRKNPTYQKAKDLVESGVIGEIRRTNWIATEWYRSQSYYNSGGWRATWKGEGGGVLLNQNPHNLDIWQWICGMPKRVFGFAYFGKHRDVEVETEVTAYVEYPNGGTGVFVTTTTETPGTDRFEIVGSQGKIVIENKQLKLWRSVVDEVEFNAAYTGGFGEPEIWQIEVPTEFDADNGHRLNVQNFVNHIRFDEELISPGKEGINGLTISNAIHLSAWEGRWVDLPIDEDLFLTRLQEHIDSSQEKETEERVLDTTNTFR